MTTTISPARRVAVRTPWAPAKTLTLGVVAAASAVVLAVVVRLWANSPPALGDLDVYRLGVSAWWHRQDLYGPLPATMAGDHLPFIYPPFSLVLLGPLTMLPWHMSAAAMLLLSIAALTIVVGLSVRTMWPTQHHRTTITVTAACVALALALEPVSDTLGFGQVNLLLMGLVALDCLPSHTRWRRGVLVGVAAAIKLTPAVFVLYFLLRKDYRAAATATITALVATAFGFLLTWHGSLEFWFGHDKGARVVSGSAYFQNQTVAAFLARLPLSPPVQTAIWLLIVAAVVVVAAIGIRRAHRWKQRTLAMSLTGCLGLIVSPTSWGHHWVYVVPGVIALGSIALARRSIRWASACAATLTVFAVAPFRFLPSAYQHWNWMQQIADNSYIIVGCVLLVCYVSPKWTYLRAGRAASGPLGSVGRPLSSPDASTGRSAAVR